MTGLTKEGIEQISAALRSGRWKDLIEHFRFPFPVYFQNSIYVKRVEQDLFDSLSVFRSKMKAAGFKIVSSRTTPEDLTADNRAILHHIVNYATDRSSHCVTLDFTFYVLATQGSAQARVEAVELTSTHSAEIVQAIEASLGS